ncbi:MAG: septum formation initiator family protein [Alphaproteobacteria bacterium]
MTLLGHLRTRAPHIIGPVIAATVFAYFAYHAVQGDRGHLAWFKLGQQVEEARLEYDRISAKRESLAARVRLLEPGSLDRDMLEERVRAVLGYVHRDEVLIPGRSGRIGGINPISVEPAVPKAASPRGTRTHALRISLERF